MKAVKILGVGVFTVALVMLCILGLDYVLSDDTDAYSRIGFHELYEQEHIDSIFLDSCPRYLSTNLVNPSTGASMPCSSGVWVSLFLVHISTHY